MWRCLMISFFFVSYTSWTSAIIPSRFISVVKFKFSFRILGGDRLILSLPSVAAPRAFLLIIYFIKSVANMGLFSVGGEGDFLMLAFLSSINPLIGLTLVFLLGSYGASGDKDFFLIILSTLLLSDIFLGSYFLTSVFPFGFKFTRFAFKILRF